MLRCAPSVPTLPYPKFPREPQAAAGAARVCPAAGCPTWRRQSPQAGAAGGPLWCLLPRSRGLRPSPRTHLLPPPPAHSNGPLRSAPASFHILETLREVACRQVLGGCSALSPHSCQPRVDRAPSAADCGPVFAGRCWGRCGARSWPWRLAGVGHGALLRPRPPPRSAVWAAGRWVCRGTAVSGCQCTCTPGLGGPTQTCAVPSSFAPTDSPLTQGGAAAGWPGACSQPPCLGDPPITLCGTKRLRAH